MSETHPTTSGPDDDDKELAGRSSTLAGRLPPGLRDTLDTKVRRIQNGRQQPAAGVWFGLGMTGLVGWTVAVPTLLGVLAGSWLDKNHPGTHAWTLPLLVAGLCLGCFNAWRWVATEDKALHRPKKSQQEPGHDNE